MSVVPMLRGQGLLIQMDQHGRNHTAFWEGPASWQMLALLDAVRAEMVAELLQRGELPAPTEPQRLKDGSIEPEVLDFGTRP